MIQSKLRNLEMLTNDHNKNEKQSDMIEELTQVKTDGIMLNESNSQPVTSEEINQTVESSQNEILKQTEVEIEPSLGSLRKVEFTHSKNYMYMLMM